MTEFFLAQEMGKQMLERLELMTLQPKVIVNLGCDTKFAADLLKKRYPEAEIIDGAEAEMLPLIDHSVDLIFANLFLPWCKHLNNVFREWKRILRPEGLLLFSSFGPDTLVQLRQNYANSLLLNLVDMHNLGDELTQARFSDPVLDVEYITVTYRDLKKLTQELQAAKALVKEVEIVEIEADSQGVFPLTYEIVYGHAWGPNIDVDHTADEAGIVKIPLSHLRRKKI